MKRYRCACCGVPTGPTPGWRHMVLGGRVFCGAACILAAFSGAS